MSVTAVLAALLVQGLSGVAGGLGLVLDPSGASLGIALDWLEGSAFSDYLSPGLVLLLVLGVGPLAALVAVWRRCFWAWRATVAVGVALLVWLAVEILTIGYHPWPPLQLAYGLLALAILALAGLPSTRQFMRAPSPTATNPDCEA
ncbi:MAG: hypothetical protein AB7H81_23575 [Vicinamibacterales bacterium]